VYNAAGGLYLRRLAEAEAHVIPGTEDALTTPFFSPGGDEIAFFRQSRLLRVPIGGGVPVEIASGVINIFGGSWSGDGTILFGQPAGIMRVPAGGGTPEIVVKAATGEAVANPQLLPGGQAILFSRYGGSVGEIVVESLSTHERTRLVSGAGHARYVSSGHLVYVVGESLFAARFDARRFQIGEASSVLPVVSSDGAFAQFDVSDNGTLVFTTSATGSGPGENAQFTWFTRTGEKRGTIGQAAAMRNFDLAPDGRVVSERVQTTGVALWMSDATREWPLVPADFRKDGFISDPSFSPTGDRVAFSSGIAGNVQRVGHQIDQIYSVSSDGGVPKPLFGKGDRATGWLEDWSPDGQRLLVLRNGSGVILTLGREAAADEVLFDKETPQLDELQFSPDGRWIAYHGNRAAGGLNVYVVPNPPTGQVYKVSGNEGGSQPKWRQDGRELFYLAPDGTLMVASIQTTPAFRAAAPTALFKTGLRVTPAFDQYAVADNGQRFLLPVPVREAGPSPQASVNIVFNWFEELERLAPKK
jgi:Tol biopolymer transport system component